MTKNKDIQALIRDLREYASNPGYSHVDYADTMRLAADALATQSPADAAPVDAKPFAYFVQPSSFGPFIECKPDQIGAFAAYRYPQSSPAPAEAVPAQAGMQGEVSNRELQDFGDSLGVFMDLNDATRIIDWVLLRSMPIIAQRAARKDSEPLPRPRQAVQPTCQSVEHEELVPGQFYWIWIALDPDASEEWENDYMPARFAGYDEAGNETWNFLDSDAVEWATRSRYLLQKPGKDSERDGWQLVPKEPTISMIAAIGFGGDEILAIGHAAVSEEVIKSYEAMLAAAPQPEEEQ